jgi:HK97 family phage major capsid protein
MAATDQMLARYVNEIEERQQLIDGVIESADGKDLNDEQMELVTRAKDRIAECNRLMAPLEEARKISGDSAERIRQLAVYMNQKPATPREVEYRSAGEYIVDMWRSRLGTQEASDRLEIYHRAASHQTTADNAGLIPTPILGPVVDFIDSNRALVTQLGPRQLPGQNWSRPLVTQHTSIAVQSAEKAELVSQKMTITKVNATASTYGGYVNVSRQDLDFTTPGIMDIVVSDLAAEYAIQTESAAATAFDTASTAGIAIPTGLPATAAAIQTSLWDAASKIYTATRGAGRVIAFMGPDMLPVIGPVFPPVTPFNAYSPGFEAVNFQTGLVGQISGIPVYVSSGVGTQRMLILSTAAGEVYEDRIGSLQVVEPSVLGVQVAYAGYFTPMVISGAGIVKVVKTP